MIGLGLNIWSARGTVALAEPYTGQLATRAIIPMTSNTANKQFNSRSYHVARDTITSLRLVLPNWYWNRAGTKLETNGPGSMTYFASVEYPAGTFTQVLFSGATSGTVAAGGNLTSDLVSVSIPTGAGFWVRVYGTGASGLVFVAGDAGYDTPMVSPSLGEAMEYAASGVTNKTMGGTITATNTAQGAPNYRPVAIIGETRRPSVLLLGDSRTWGLFDHGDAQGNQGEATRALGPSYAYINAGCSGDVMDAFTAGGSKRAALAQYVSHVVTAYGTNDIRSTGDQSDTAATALAQQQTLLGMFPDHTRLVATLAPMTTTNTGLTPLGSEAQRVTFNDALRAGVAQSSATIEIADVAETSRNSGRWKTSYTADGLHASLTGYAAISTAFAASPPALTR